ncbi:PD-(D/E)XK nuclease family transposase [Sporomusa termitida]|uniref:PD-(D/E)XK nuclease family transposase n=1 Tax=Sporomusa termitida TaxID=2377 RepID=A0A517E1F4_9FIRM|nr:PD-(D/E)XK nuclease family transposase [Sporomusa termitida]
MMRSVNRMNDYVFKRILGSEGNKDILINFLNAVLKSHPVMNSPTSSCAATNCARKPSWKSKRLSMVLKRKAGQKVKQKVRNKN